MSLPELRVKFEKNKRLLWIAYEKELDLGPNLGMPYFQTRPSNFSWSHTPDTPEIFNLDLPAPSKLFFANAHSAALLGTWGFQDK